MLTVTLTERKFVFQSFLSQMFEPKIYPRHRSMAAMPMMASIPEDSSFRCTLSLRIIITWLNFLNTCKCGLPFTKERILYIQCTIVQCTLYSVHGSLIRIILSRDWVGEEEQVAHRSLLHQLSRCYQQIVQQ